MFTSNAGVRDNVAMTMTRNTSVKVALASDVHLEFGPLQIINDEGADVLILSGDILVASDLSKPDPLGIMDSAKHNRLVDFFNQCSAAFPHVVYVAGNHEHYHGDYAKSHERIREFVKQFGNVHFLENETFEYKDTVYAGCTLWTDMNKNDPATLRHVANSMNDFRVVSNSNRMVSFKTPKYAKDEARDFVIDPNTKTFIQEGLEFKTRVSTFSPGDAYDAHLESIEFLTKVYNETPPWKQIVVLTHHSPSKKSTHPRYADEVLMNGAYSSDLSDFIEQRPGIKLWTHGHTHEDFDYVVGSTRIVCNPRGYINYEERASHFQLKFLEF